MKWLSSWFRECLFIRHIICDRGCHFSVEIRRQLDLNITADWYSIFEPLWIAYLTSRKWRYLLSIWFGRNPGFSVLFTNDTSAEKPEDNAKKWVHRLHARIVISLQCGETFAIGHPAIPKVSNSFFVLMKWKPRLRYRVSERDCLSKIGVEESTPRLHN